MNEFDRDNFKGKVFKSKNYGDFVVTDYINAKNVRVRFVGTGFETFAESGKIRTGCIKDKLFPAIYGVGFISEGKYKVSVNRKHTPGYNCWHRMLERCYSIKSQKQKPTYINTTVCKSWHNYQNYCEWHEANFIEGCELDKDIFQKGVKNKVYSPETCCFVNHQVNSEEARAKHYEFTRPSGEEVSIYNLSSFCSENELHQSAMSEVHSGRRNHHKGWKRIESNHT